MAREPALAATQRDPAKTSWHENGIFEAEFAGWVDGSRRSQLGHTPTFQARNALVGFSHATAFPHPGR